jgi:L-ascorbate metabolism protein UlaG (beta-lactamase superfamily)
VKITYLGTACLLLEYGGLRLLTDPAFDPAGTRYDFGPWYTPRSWFASEKTYETPLARDALGEIDAVLLSHDQHADNLDYEGRKLVASKRVRAVITTEAAARRLARPASRGANPESEQTEPCEGLGLAERARGIPWGGSLTLGRVAITATPGRHGPIGTPRVHEVAGFRLEAQGEPTVWISGDTVLESRVRDCLGEMVRAGRRVDVAVVHCGAVSFPKLPVLGKRLFTFDAAQALEACRILDPGAVVPIHRDGWTHFRQPEAALRDAFDRAGLAERARFLALGEGAAF